MSKEASITVPFASVSGSAFNSNSSDSKRTFSSNSSIPVPFFAEISWHWYLPPQSSTRIFIADNSSLILSGLAVGISHLFNANTIGTPAACE